VGRTHLKSRDREFSPSQVTKRAHKISTPSALRNWGQRDYKFRNRSTTLEELRYKRVGYKISYLHARQSICIHCKFYYLVASKYYLLHHIYYPFCMFIFQVPELISTLGNRMRSREVFQHFTRTKPSARASQHLSIDVNRVLAPVNTRVLR
jgi:hypothetical protein